MRGDLADVRLADRVFAPHYALAIDRTAIAAAPILAGTKRDSPILSEILAGERFEVLELATRYAWGICAADGTVGYVDCTALAETPDRPAVAIAGDPASAAESVLGAPAKPGGRSPAGFDSAGLIFYILTATGHGSPRFCDLQAAALGQPVPGDQPLARGDLLFFADHAAILVDGDTAIHVTNSVVREPLDTVIANFGPLIARRRP